MKRSKHILLVRIERKWNHALIQRDDLNVGLYEVDDVSFTLDVLDNLFLRERNANPSFLEKKKKNVRALSVSWSS